ncbi:hypothetical protein F5Y13DRAFT_174653 [Hypoxylon sp. FL1857]|nr:hypothetical protein F5Y13DRAFT_174653 [Hypoxylon sp. FL1857]
MVAPLVPGQIAHAVQGALVYDERNPNHCPCGWYTFYGRCGHLFTNHPYKCGAAQTVSLVSKFCRSPAPRHNVPGYVVTVDCDGCRRR